jgi:NAD(P)-dependent dehydrogenase (short-subunit alcohol dehydrogenase family)
MSNRLSRKVYIITGTGGKMGREAALTFAREGALKQSEIRSISMTLISALALIAAVGCSSGSAKSAPATPPAPLVTAALAKSQDVPRYLDEVGRNAAFETVTVTPQVGGRIIERHFKDGDNLKPGSSYEGSRRQLS